MEDVAIDTFCDRLKPRVAIRTGVVWAGEPTLLERFGALIDHPLAVAYAKVATAGMVGFVGLMLTAGAMMIWGPQ